MLAVLLGGCAWLQSLQTETDETVGWSAQRLYGEAKDAMNEGSWATAIKYLEKLEARYPYGRFAQQAQLEIAYAYYRDNERASAVAACDRFIKLYPNHANVDYAYYLKGVVNFNEDQNILTRFATPDPTERDPKSARDSFDAFKELATRYPDSKYTADALARMHYLVNSLASHEVHVAQYYMKRGAYVAAANRADYAVKTYPEAPAIEDALALMARAYDQLGMDDLRDDALRVLKTNFPNSPWLKGDVVRSDPWWRLWGK